ncbi:MAG TPA: M28 family peptidase [Acidobacteriota bacterium]|nr:M28 family peptidase [Acidobacteriota bacterium]
MRAFCLLMAGLCQGLAAETPSDSDRLRRRGLESITLEELREDVEFFSSEAMRGREAGSEANRRSAEFLAERFSRLGLEPAGEEGYFQPVTLVRSLLAGDNRLLFKTGRTGAETPLSLQETFTAERFSASGEASGRLVFAGYGITAPEWGYDDYQQVDVDGRIVLILPGQPEGRDEDARHGQELEKLLNAQRHGAAAAIVLDRSHNMSFSAHLAWPKDLSTQRFLLQEEVDQVRIPAVRVALEAVEERLLTSGLDVELFIQESGRYAKPRSFLLPSLEAELAVSVERQAFQVRNVLGRLEGSDPQVSQQVVVLGAHFDHIGTRGAEIYPGADDNASGVSALLEIAEALTEGRRPPRRSVLFAGFNAEEKGLLGSRHYVRHARIPLDETVAMFQMDMIGRDEEIPATDDYRFTGLELQTARQNQNALNVLGYSFSQDLRELVNRSNRRVLLQVRFRYDDHPIDLLQRSDQWPFLERGVPSLLFTTGLHPDYHRPGDTADKLNYSKMERVAQLVYLCVWEAAEAQSRPAFDGTPLISPPGQ